MIQPLAPRTRLTEQEAADYLGRKKETLRSWRKAGTAPRYINLRGRIWYRVDWLEDYLEAHVEEPIFWPHATRQAA